MQAVNHLRAQLISFELINTTTEPAWKDTIQNFDWNDEPTNVIRKFLAFAPNLHSNLPEALSPALRLVRQVVQPND